MSDNKYFDALGQPFPYSDVHWRMQHVDTTKEEGFAVPYLDARAVEDRLDKVIGQDNWNDTYENWHAYTETTTDRDKTTVKEIRSQLCTIYVYNKERDAWLGKTDGAENTDFESIKGGLSDSFKRAAVKWNVGRYMYKMNPIWVKAKKRGRSYIVHPDEEAKLKDEYFKIIKSVFGEEAATKLEGKSNTSAGNKSTSQKQGSQNTTERKPSESHTEAASNQTEIYVIKNIRVEGSGNNVRSALVLNKGNGDNTVFMRGSDPKLKIGSKIKNVKGRTGKNSYGQYSILESYEIAA